MLFVALLSALCLTPASAGAAMLYAALGPELAQYQIDVEGAALTRRGQVTLPDNVQYAWPHPSGKFLYVAWSDGSGGKHHGVTAFRIGGSGVLTPLGEAVSLPSRPVHITVDIAGTHLLAAFNDPIGLSVYGLRPDGAIAGEVKQPAALDFGIYAHQVRVDPSDRSVILTTRGNGPARGKAEDPGALKVFGYRNGALTNRASIAPNRGFGFQPRHLDFHPSENWVFVSLERQNQLQVYRKRADGSLDAEPLFTKNSLASAEGSGQAAGTVHVHPNGRFVYQANRSGRAAGENSIAVYAIDPSTGEPRLIQSAATRGLEPRTFALDPGGRILAAANQNTRDLALFRVQPDGKLDFVRKYDAALGGGTLFWMGIAGP